MNSNLPTPSSYGIVKMSTFRFHELEEPLELVWQKQIPWWPFLPDLIVASEVLAITYGQMSANSISWPACWGTNMEGWRLLFSIEKGPVMPWMTTNIAHSADHHCGLEFPYLLHSFTFLHSTSPVFHKDYLYYNDYVKNYHLAHPWELSTTVYERKFRRWQNWLRVPFQWIRKLGAQPCLKSEMKESLRTVSHSEGKNIFLLFTT